MTYQEGWYPDPQNQNRERYYNGKEWTTRVRHKNHSLILLAWIVGIVVVISLGIGILQYAVQVQRNICEHNAQTFEQMSKC